MGIPGLKRFIPSPSGTMAATIGDWIMALSGLLALAVVCAPVVLDLTTRISGRRIWAIARLSWKEAIRGRVIWVFGAMALVFLFADWFVPAKAEDQLRTYVRVVYWSMTPLFLLTAALLGAFSIPNDVNNNSIHTIVTKPVEKFEVVLGRFFGYAGLLTAGLFIVSCLSLIYVLRGVNEDAAYESFKARVPAYGTMRFLGTKNESEGENVGREWTHRSYITGPTQFKPQALRQYAVWDFAQIPAQLRTQEEPIVFEFAFDIFRLSKGIQGEGVYCSFTFVHVTKDMPPDYTRQGIDLAAKVEEMNKARDKARTEAQNEFDRRTKNLSDDDREALHEAHNAKLEEIERQLITKYRIYQKAGQEVTDQHTQDIVISAKDFQALLQDADGQSRDPARPVLRVFVSVDMASQAQMVGVAPYDFYLLPTVRPFWQNFLKGIVGMWCTYMLVLAVAVACSTYLSGVISFLMALILYVAGLNVAFLREIADHRMIGGGPIEASIRLSTKKGQVGELEATPTVQLVKAADYSFSWLLGRVLNLIPDLERHDLHQFVANGFDIGWVDILLLDNFLPLAGYLLPWAVLGYYLMKYREIANPQ
jgi:hypothetical protein